MPEKHFELEVAEVNAETEDACSISFRVPRHLQQSFEYKPGQFLTVAVPSAETGSVARCYSISSCPETSDSTVTVTVKRTEGGYASNWICDNVRTGLRMTVLPPAGTFTVRSWKSDLLLFAAGSGITPMMSILRTALLSGTSRVALFYANRDAESVIFRDELHSLAAAHPDRFVMTEWLESERGLPGHDDVVAIASPRLDWDAYCCGPAPFMSMAMGALADLDFPSERRHQEKFTSLSGNPFEAAQPSSSLAADSNGRDDSNDSGSCEPGLPEAVTQLKVEIDGKVLAFPDWPADMTLLEFLESKSLKVPSSCREGECSACSVLLVEGEVTMRNNEVLDDDDLVEGTRLACQSRPTTKVVRVSYE